MICQLKAWRFPEEWPMTENRMMQRRKGTPRSWVPRYLRLPLIVASIAWSLTGINEASATPPKQHFNSKKTGLRVTVQDGGWGGARTESIETVLYSVADELLSRLPKQLAFPIIVAHTNSNPVALYERGPGGEYWVHLHASGEAWHLYAYEFAHELCHILSNYDENVGPGSTRYNQWFEETLCETASLFVLKRLAKTWEISPPEPKWSNEAKKLQRFFVHLISEGHRQLPADTPLANWLHDREEQLRNEPYQRTENEVVANLLLPLFEENPQNWEALSYLNLDPSDSQARLGDYLHHWYESAPVHHKQFVASILSMFGLDDVLTTALSVVPDRTTIALTSDFGQR
jgi:hypothetical protein